MNPPNADSASPAEAFAARLKKIRERQQINQSELARRSGLTAAAVSQLEGGLREPNFSTILRLATALNTTPNDLLDIGADVPADPSVQALFRDVKQLEREDFEAVKAFAQFLAQKKNK